MTSRTGHSDLNARAIAKLVGVFPNPISSAKRMRPALLLLMAKSTASFWNGRSLVSRASNSFSL